MKWDKENNNGSQSLEEIVNIPWSVRSSTVVITAFVEIGSHWGDEEEEEEEIERIGSFENSDHGNW